MVYLKTVNRYVYLLLNVLCIFALTSCKSEDVFRNYADTESFNSSTPIIDLTDTAEIVFATDGTELIDFKHTVNAGEDTSLTLKAEEFIEYRIEVEYSSGISRSKALTPRKSDLYGFVTWNWQVGTKCRPGTYPVRIYRSSELIFETRLTIK